VARTHIRQDTQVASTNQTVDGYDDSKTLGVVLETGAASLLDDLNALRSVLAYIRDLQAGSWRDPLADPTANGDTGTARGVQGLNTGIYALERARFLVLRNLLTSVTVPASANVAVLGAGELPIQTQIGVGTTDTLGTVVAAHSGTFGDHALDVVTGVHVLAPKNLLVITASTGAPILSGGRQVWGLLQSENATDGHTATETTPDRLQISFVRPTVGFDGLEAVPTAGIQNKVFRYGYAERLAFQQLLEQDLFPTEASQTAGSGSGGSGGNQTLNEVINATIPDNDVSVPLADPVIFRDGEVRFAHALTIEETADHPVDPEAGLGQVWVNSADKRLYFTDETGRDIDLTDDPKTIVITRDGNDCVLTVTATGEATWTVSRNPDDSISSLDNGIYNVAVNRDGNGLVTGVTSVKL
jgi:hypothetical protein